MLFALQRKNIFLGKMIFHYHSGSPITSIKQLTERCIVIKYKYWFAHDAITLDTANHIAREIKFRYTKVLKSTFVSVQAAPFKATRGGWLLLFCYADGPLRWRHNDHAGVSNHQPRGCLLNRLFRRRSKKTSKLRVTGLCAGNSPGTGEFPAKMASYAENISIWWRHHARNTIMI